MCAGPDCVLLREDVKAKLFSAFAALDPNSGARTLPAYKRWVEKLATREFADELVVLACAMELKIKIVCVPHTPDGLELKWAISTYMPQHPLPDAMSVYLGSNDVRYMWLAKG